MYSEVYTHSQLRGSVMDLATQYIHTGPSEDFVAWTTLSSAAQLVADASYADKRKAPMNHAYFAGLNCVKKKFHQMPANTGGTVCCAVRGGQACQETS